MSAPDGYELMVCGWEKNPRHCVYLNDYRIAGGKPWGGAHIASQWRVSLSDLANAIPAVQRALEAADELDRLAAENARLREALKECVEVLALVEHPRHKDPTYGDEVEALGRRIGFGALMSSAQASWRTYLAERGGPVGGEHVAGPAQATITRALSIARQALEQQP